MSSYVLFTRTDRRSRLFALISHLAEKFSHASERRRAVTTLSQMSDYQLRDIGVSRSAIDHVIDKGREQY